MQNQSQMVTLYVSVVDPGGSALALVSVHVFAAHRRRLDARKQNFIEVDALQRQIIDPGSIG